MTKDDRELIELKPCPVCGDQPKWRGSRSDYARGIYRLQCLGETHLFQAYGPSEEKCAEHWNTRAAVSTTVTPFEVERTIYEADPFLRDGVQVEWGDGWLAVNQTEAWMIVKDAAKRVLALVPTPERTRHEQG